MSTRFWISLGALANAIGVVLGAFGAHLLKSRLQPEDMQIYDTAIRYLFIHASALIIVGLLVKQVNYQKSLMRAGFCFIAGIIIFCGSLFLLIATHMKFLGAITPLGGLSFIIGWLMLAAAMRK